MSKDKASTFKPLRGQQLAAELAAYSLARDVPDLEGRERMTGIAIDDADPTEPKDRDDAVSVEYKTDEKGRRLTILHVTIADVASVVPLPAEKESNTKLAALDMTARDYAATKYFAHGSRPMFPRRLQDHMSLEHHKERPGLTTSITFDDHCRPIHTRFSRTRIRTTCKSYREANEDLVRVGSDSNQVQHIALLAKNLLRRKPGDIVLPSYDSQTGMYFDTEGGVRHISSEASSAYMAVQGCMIAANEQAAELMSKSNFMFRNHYRSVDGVPIYYMEGHASKRGPLAKAEYSGQCLGHYGLSAPVYSHVTSPIRRYADVANQRMQHFAIDVVDAMVTAAQKSAVTRDPAMTHDKLDHYVWAHAKDLLGKVTALKEAGRGRGRIDAERELRQEVEKLLEPVIEKSQRGVVANEFIRELEGIRIPYLKKEMMEVSGDLNLRLHGYVDSRSHDEIMNATLDSIFRPEIEAGESGFEPNVDLLHEAIRKRRPFKFALLLEAAAKRGEINDFFATEVRRRLTSDEDRSELVRNLHTLLVTAATLNDSHWSELRKEAFNMIKADPLLAARVFTYTQAEHEPPKIFIAETTLLDKGNMPHPAALVVLNHEGVDYSSPVLDTGDSPDEARRGAIVTFFRHYGELAPHEELYTPKLIDVALGLKRMRKGQRRALLEKLCGTDFRIEESIVENKQSPESCKVTLRMVRNSDGETLEKEREGWTQFATDYLDKLAGDMIVDRRFLDLVSDKEMPFDLLDQSRLPPALFARKADGGIDRRVTARD